MTSWRRDPAKIAKKAAEDAIGDAVNGLYEVKGQSTTSQLPANPETGDRFRISSSGIVNGIEVKPNDHVHWDGTEWVVEYTSHLRENGPQNMGSWNPNDGAPSNNAENGQFWTANQSGEFAGVQYDQGDRVVRESNQWVRYDWVDNAGLDLRGGWDASTGAYPASPKEKDVYHVTTAGEVVEGTFVRLFEVGDTITWTGGLWLQVVSREHGQVADRRGTNELPSWYKARYPRLVCREFKVVEDIGLPRLQGHAAMYGLLETIPQWSSDSGGDVHQKITMSDGAVFQRNQKQNANKTGMADAWTDWQVMTDRLANAVGEVISSRRGGLISNGDGSLSACDYLAGGINFSGIADLDGDITDEVTGDYEFADISLSDELVDNCRAFAAQVRNTNIANSELISIDPLKHYQLKAKVRYIDPSVTGRTYLSVLCYDIDGQLILPQHGEFRAGTNAVLTQPLSPGDATVHITAAGDGDLNSWYQGATWFYRRIALGPYTSPSGVVHDDWGYTRHIEGSAGVGAYADGGFDSATGILQVEHPNGWQTANPDHPDGIWPVGTPITNPYGGGWGQYAGGSVLPTDNEWHELLGIIGGLANGVDSDNVFRLGTCAIRVALFANVSGSGVGEIRFADVDLREVKYLGTIDEANWPPDVSSEGQLYRITADFAAVVQDAHGDTQPQAGDLVMAIDAGGASASNLVVLARRGTASSIV